MDRIRKIRYVSEGARSHIRGMHLGSPRGRVEGKRSRVEGGGGGEGASRTKKAGSSRGENPVT